MIAAAVWSAIGPEDYAVWAFELIPGGLLTAVLILTFRRFRFSDLVYVLICLQFLILATGAKYTYAEVPLFNWLRDELDFSRNHFDRVGHFVQGFVPAMIVREYLLRRTPLERGPILFTFVVSVCLAFSAFYEIVESWFVLLFYPDEGPQWLGMQGDAFDAQWDMTMALLGALLALTLLARVHDRSIEQVLALRARPAESAA
jgi:putative membrane protein